MGMELSEPLVSKRQRVKRRNKMVLLLFMNKQRGLCHLHTSTWAKEWKKPSHHWDASEVEKRFTYGVFRGEVVSPHAGAGRAAAVPAPLRSGYGGRQSPRNKQLLFLPSITRKSPLHLFDPQENCWWFKVFESTHCVLKYTTRVESGRIEISRPLAWLSSYLYAPNEVFNSLYRSVLRWICCCIHTAGNSWFKSRFLLNF